jgi:hypothetical protein
MIWTDLRFPEGQDQHQSTEIRAHMRLVRKTNSGTKMNTKIAAILGIAVVVAMPSLVNATPIMPDIEQPSMITLVAGGCGPNGWRGPWGHCRYTPYYGGLPNGYYQPRPVGNGCPPGYWRGPWGHCRNTPYHGRLPGGGWK